MNQPAIHIATGSSSHCDRQWQLAVLILPLGTTAEQVQCSAVAHLQTAVKLEKKTTSVRVEAPTYLDAIHMGLLADQMGPRISNASADLLTTLATGPWRQTKFGHPTRPRAWVHTGKLPPALIKFRTFPKSGNGKCSGTWPLASHDLLSSLLHASKQAS